MPVFNAGPRLKSTLRMSLPALACALLAQGAMAASKGADSDAQQRYKTEKAACMSGKSQQERSTCLKEANAALYEAKRGKLTSDQTSFDQNATSRCNSLPADQRDLCRRGIQAGNQQGSVEGGGILREYHETVAVPASSMPADTSSGSSMTSGTGSSGSAAGQSSGSTSYPNPNSYPGSSPSGNTYPGSTPGPTPSGSSPSSNSMDQMHNHGGHGDMAR